MLCLMNISVKFYIDICLDDILKFSFLQLFFYVSINLYVDI